MAGELHEVSRLLGQIESKLEMLSDNHGTTHERLQAIEQKLQPLDAVVSDHARIKATQERHDALVQRGYGMVLAVSTFIAAIGFLIHELGGYALRKLGWSS